MRRSRDWTLTRGFGDHASSSARKVLAELAVMSALAAWLRRWKPVAIDGAILAGARPGAVAGALGDTVAATFDLWHGWATRNRKWTSTTPLHRASPGQVSTSSHKYQLP